MTKTPYAAALPITIQERMTVEPKETDIAFIGLEASLASMDRLARNSVGRYNERLTFPILVLPSQAICSMEVHRHERRTTAVLNWL